jgi:hypothetical protein
MENIETLQQETKKEGCKTCKKGVSTSQKWMIVIAVYMLISSAYGTIELIRNIFSLF